MSHVKALFLFFFFYTLFIHSIYGQTKYFVKFKESYRTNDKLAISPRSINRKEKYRIKPDALDYAIDDKILSKFSALGCEARYTRWLFGAIAELDRKLYEEVKKLDMVDTIIQINQTYPNKATAQKFETLYSDTQYGSTYDQISMIGLNEWHQKGYKGKGIEIAIFDGGYLDMDTLRCFQHLYTGGQVLSTHNIVDPTQSVYSRDHHGTAVAGCIAALVSDTIIGTAPEAKFHLFVTEDVYSESRIEEYNWLLAAEMADSIGVDIINSSLGYSTFDILSESYIPENMDGETTIISRAAKIASQKGIVVVNSAGNSGNNEWKIINAPSDAEDVITVGAVDYNRNLAAFSSIGTQYRGFIKPNVCALGVSVACYLDSKGVMRANGTSFSAPIISGAIACIMQRFPDLSPIDIKWLLYRASHQFHSPDIEYGFGIPYLSFNQSMDTLLQFKIYPNPTRNYLIIERGQESLSEKIDIYYYSSMITTNPIIIKQALSDSRYNWLDISHVGSGIGWINIKWSKGNIWQKILKLN